MSEPIEDACMACLDRWMAALNRYDAAAMDAELHFPNVRFAESKLTVFDKPSGNAMDLFKRLKQEDAIRGTRKTRG